MLKVKLNKIPALYRPGETIEATIYWQFDNPPKTLSASVAWHTRGKGTEDSKTILSESWDDLPATGSRPVQFVLPRGPLSLEGSLIHIRWELKCAAKKPNEETSAPFVLSHLKSPMRLMARTPSIP